MMKDLAPKRAELPDSDPYAKTVGPAHVLNVEAATKVRGPSETFLPGCLSTELIPEELRR